MSDRTTSLRNRTRGNRRDRILLQKLEDRVLFSASPLAAEMPEDAAGNSNIDISFVESRPTEVVFVDSAVENAEDWVAQLEADKHVEIHLLAADVDGVEQIAIFLEGREDITALHIISHGDQAELQLGNARLNSTSMGGIHAEPLGRIKSALQPGADLLIYGCNFSQGEAGHEAASTLGLLVGADVAASTDLTGNADNGGDWDLEYFFGSIETELALSNASQSSLTGTLQIVDISLNVVSDGTPTFDPNDNPGNDSGANNGIIRSHDLVNLELFYNADAGGATNPTFTSTLPDGLVWEFLPPQAAFSPNSGIFDSVTGLAGGDMRTIVLQIPDIGGTITSSIALQARALGMQNGTPLNDIKFEATTDENPTTLETPEDHDLVISSGANMDIRLLSPWFRGTHTDASGTVDGVVYQYSIGVLGDHPTRTGTDAVKGSAPIEDPFTFDIDLSNVSPNAQLFNWGPTLGYLNAEYAQDGITRNYERFVDNAGTTRTVWSHSGRPAGQTYEHPTSGAWQPDRAVPNSGDWTATQTGQTISATVTGAETSGEHFPTRSGGNGLLPAGDKWFASGTFYLWIPIDDILPGADGITGTADDGALQITPEIVGFDPDDTWGDTNNFGDEDPLLDPDTDPAFLEDTANNDYRHTVLASSLGGSVKRIFESGIWRWVDTSTYWYSGDGVTSVGHQYDIQVHSGQNHGVLPVETPIWGDKFDNTAQKIVPIADYAGANRSNSLWSRGYSSGQTTGAIWLQDGVDYVMEFGTGGEGGVGATWSDWDSMGDATLADGETSTIWTTDPTDPALGGTADPVTGVRDSITKWRTRLLRDLQPGEVIYTWVTLETTGRSTLDPVNNPTGDIIADQMAQYRPTTGAWITSEYDPSNNSWNTDGTSSDIYRGDRLTYVDAQVRIDKQIIDVGSGNLFLAGSAATVQIDGTVTIPGPDSGVPAQDVYVTDILPAGLTVVAGSVSPQAGDTYLQDPTDPASTVLTVQGVEYWDGTSWSSTYSAGASGVRWNFGDVPLNTELPTMTFDVLIPFDAQNGEEYLNDAFIESPSDSSTQDWRDSQAGLVAVQTVAFSSGKSVLTPLIPEDGTIIYELGVANVSTDKTVPWFDAVDVLPYDGDFNGSSFSGDFSNIDVTNLPAGIDVYVSSTSPGLLDSQDGVVDGYADPGTLLGGQAWYVTPGTVGSQWEYTLADAQASVAGAPAMNAITALRFVSDGSIDPHLPAGVSLVWNIELETDGNLGDPSDNYENSFVARTNPLALPLPVFSPTATATVIAPAIEIDKEVCLDETGVNCDPFNDAHWGETATFDDTTTATFRVKVVNTGTADLTTTVTDNLPAGMTYVAGSANPTLGDVTGFPPTWTLNLAAGATAYMTFDASTANATDYTNTASVSAVDQFGEVVVDSDPADVEFVAEISVTKHQTDVQQSTTNPGRWDVTYEVEIENTSVYDLTQLTLTEDLNSHFGAGYTGVVSPPAITTSSLSAGGALPTLDGTWNGMLGGAGNDQMFNGTTGTLKPGDSITVEFTVEVDLSLAPDPMNMENQVTAGAANGVTDDSDDGDDPNSDNPTFPGDDGAGGVDDPTPLIIPHLEFEKRTVSTTPASSGTLGNFDVTFDFTFWTDGNDPLSQLIFEEDFATQYGGAFVGLVGAPTITATTATDAPEINAAYDGGPTDDLLFDNTGANTNLLEYGQSVTIRMIAEVDPNSPTAVITAGDLINQAGVSGQGIETRHVDLSDDPNDATDVNPDGDNDPDDPNHIRFPLISLEKQITAVAPAISGIVGNYEARYELVIENTGSASLDTLSLVENFAANYGGAFVRIVTPPSIIASTASDVPELNAAYDGGLTDAQLFNNSGANTNLLASGETITIAMIVEIDPDNGTAVYDAISGDGNHDLENQATVSGTDINTGGLVTDNSDDPTDATNVDDDADADPDDPTALVIPEIELIKSLVGSPLPAASGVENNFDVTFDLEIRNNGTTQLNMLTLQDNLASQYGGAFVQVVGSPTIQASTATDDPEFNAAYDGGTTDAFLFDNTGANTNQLLSGESVTIRIVVEINPDDPTANIVDGNLTNAADVRGEDEYSATHDDQDDEVIRIPRIGLDKEIVSTPTQAASGTQGNYDVTYQFSITNDGSTDLDDITLQEDFAAQFGGGFVGLVGGPTVVSSTATDTPEFNTSYDGGLTDAELFDNSGPHTPVPFTFLGSNSRTTVGKVNYSGAELFVIDPNQTYDLEVDVVAGDGAGGNYDPASRHYIGFVSYDVDGNAITTYNYMKHPGSTDTTLAAPLNPGDTTITLANAAGWSNGGPNHTRSIAWYGYQDSTGYVHPDYTYTRNFESVAWDAGGIFGNVITLNAPWAGPALASGDAVRNAMSGGTYQYSLASLEHVGQTTETLTATIGGGITTSGQYGTTLFRPGTHSISALVLADYTNTGTELTVTDFEITPNCESLLRPGESVTIEVTVEIDPNNPTAILDSITGDGDLDFENQANVTGNDFLAGTTVDDHSDDPTDASNADDDGDGEPDDPTELILPDVSLSKRIRIAPSQIGQNWEVFYELMVENTGNTVLTNFNVFDDISTEFGNAYVSVDDLSVNGFSGGSAAPTANLAWEANTAASMVTGGTLNPGASFLVRYSVIVDPDGIDSVSQSLDNQASVEADAINNDGVPVTVTDLSDNGEDPNTDNGEGGTDDPTPLLIADLGITKAIAGSPYKLANGNFKVDYKVVVENIGTVDLAALSLIEDLAAEFGAGFVAGTNLAITAGPTDPRSSITLDAAWTGSAAGAEMVDLTAANLLAIGDQFTLTFCVEVDAEAISGQPAAPRIFTDEAAFAAATGATLEEDFTHIVATNTPIALPYVGPTGVTIDGTVVSGFANPVELRADPDFVNGHAPDQGVIAFRNVSFFNSTANLRLTVPNPGTSIGFGFADVFDPSNGGLPGETHFRVIASDGTVLYDHDEAVDGQIRGNTYRFIGIQGDGSTTYTHVDIEFASNGNDNWAIDHIYGFGTTPAAHANQIEGTAQGVDAAGNPLNDRASTPLIAHDLSDNGSEPSDPNTGELNDSGGHNDPTPLFLPCIKLEKELFGTPAAASSGTSGNVDVTYDFTISNTGTEALESLSLIDDLFAQYGGAFVRIVPQAGAVATIVSSTATDGIELNAAYDGGLTNSQLVDNSGANTNLLEGNQSITVRVVIEIDPDHATAIYDGNGNLENQATTEGTGAETGTIVDDLSDDPNDPTDDDPNSDGNPDDPTLIRIPLISLEKQVIGTPVDASSGAIGNYDVTYQFVIENTGTTSLDNLTLIEDLQTQFGGAFIGIVGTPAITASTATDDPGINAAYNGTAANSNIFDASASLLNVNETITVEIVVEVDPNSATATYDAITADGNGDLENQATVTGDDTATGTTVDDHSDDPTDATNNDDNADNDPDDPTALVLPDIRTVKRVDGPATRNADGTFTVPYTITLQNTGNVLLNNPSIFDNLANQFGAYFNSVNSVALDTTGIVGGTNPAIAVWTGAGGSIISGGSLAPGDEVTVTFNVVLENSSTVAASLTNPNLFTGFSVNGLSYTPVSNAFSLSGETDYELTGDESHIAQFNADADSNWAGTFAFDITQNAAGATPFDQAALVTGGNVTFTGASGNDTVFGNMGGFYIPGGEVAGEPNDYTFDMDFSTLVNGYLPAGTTIWFQDVDIVGVETPTMTGVPASGSNASFLVPLDTFGTGTPAVLSYDNVANSHTLAAAGSNAGMYQGFVTSENLTALSLHLPHTDSGGSYKVFFGAPSEGLPEPNLKNQAFGRGTSPTGQNTTDLSDDGDDPETDNPAFPGHHAGSHDDPTCIEIPAIELEKVVVGSPVAASSGTVGNFDVTYDLTITNYGLTELDTITLVEDFAAQFGGAFVSIVPQAGAPAAIVASTANDDPGINAAYDGGTNNANVFDGSSSLLGVADSVTVRIVVELDPDSNTAVYDAVSGDGSGDFENQASTTGTDPNSGTIVDDNSDDPTDLTNNDDDGDTDPDDPTTLLLPAINLEKSAVGTPVPALSGTSGNFDITYDLVITNTGNEDLASLSLVEDLAAQYGGAFVRIVGTPTVQATTAADDPELNGTYDGGTTDSQLFDNTGANTNLIAPRESVTIRIVIEVDPDAGSAIYNNGALENQATVEGTGTQSGNTVDDESDDPTDATNVDPDGDNDPDDPNEIRIPNISLEKEAVQIIDAGSGTRNNIDVTYEFTITNTGTTPLENLTLVEDFATQFGGAFVELVGTPTISASTATDDPGFNAAYDGGTTDAQLFDASSSLLAVGESVTIRVAVELDPDNSLATYDAITGDGNNDLENQATVTGDDPATGDTVNDNSDDPTDATDNDDDADNDPDDPTSIIIPDVSLTKSSIGSPVPAASGTEGNFDVTFEFTITNTGQGVLTNMSLVEDFRLQYGGAFVGVTTPAAITASTATDPIELNAAYDGGVADAELFDNAVPNTNQLDEGESVTLLITVELDPDSLTAVTTNGDLINQATTTGTGEDGTTVSDDSDNPSDATNDDPDDDGNPDDPNPIRIPNISLTKQSVAAANASSGTANNVDITYEFVIENTGTTDLENLTLGEDFAAQFGGAFVSLVGTPTITASTATDDPGVNAAYDGGTTDALVFDASTSLVEPNQTVTVQIVVELDRDNASANYDAITGDGSGDLENQATVTGDDPTTNITVDDNSDSPTDPTNNDDDGDNDPDDPTTIIVPDIELTKSSIGTPVPATSGTEGNFDVTFEFTITNTGQGALTNLSLIEDFATQYGGAFVGVTTPAAITASTATDAVELNAAYDGGTNNAELFDNAVPNTNLLDEGESITLQITVEVDPNSATAVTTGGDLINQAQATGTGEDGTTTSDDSDNPSDATNDDPDDDGNPDDPNPIRIPNISLTKQAAAITDASSGTENHVDVTFEFVITNTGSTDLENLTLGEDFATQFGGAFVSLVGTPTIIASTATDDPGLNAAYDGGTTDPQVFDGTSSLIEPNQTVTVQIVVEVDRDSATANYDAVSGDGSGDLENQATASGDDPTTGNTVDDNSDNPTDPTNIDDDGDNDPDDPTTLFVPDIDLTKSIVGVPVPATSGIAGNFDVTFEFTITNTGDGTLTSLSLLEDFATQFGGAFVGVTTAPTTTASTATDAVELNAAFDGGTTDAELFDNAVPNTNLLDEGESITIQLTVEIDPDAATAVTTNGDLINQATTEATADDGTTPSDTSDDPTNPTDDDPDNDGDPDDPTDIRIPNISLTKQIVGTPAAAASGTEGNFDVVYELTIENDGTTPLENLTLTEDIATQFGGAFVGLIGTPTITATTATTAPTINAAYDGGTADDQLFDGSASLLDTNETVTLQLVFEIDPDNVAANFDAVTGDGNEDLENQATVTGDDPATGTTVEDNSDDPTDPTNNDDDDDNDPDDPTGLFIADITLQKQVVGTPIPATSGVEGNFDVTYQFTITNTGNAELSSLSLLEDFATQFGGAFVSIVTSPSVTATTATDDPGLNAAYDGGTTDAEIFDGSSALLDINESLTIELVVELDPNSVTANYDAVSGDGSGDLENQATVSAEDPTGAPVEDLSDDPTNPTDDDPDDDNNPDDPSGLYIADITLEKTGFGSAVPASSGTSGHFDITYDLTITNTGNDELTGLSLLEDLATQFGGAFIQIVGSPTIVSSTASDNPEINAAYDGGTSDAELFNNGGANTNLLDVNESVTVRIVIEVDPDNPTANYTNGALVNQATTEATGTGGGDTVTDDSDDPTDLTNEDPDDDNNPDDPSEIRIPNISIEKSVPVTPVPASSGVTGNFDVTYQFVISNDGTTPLVNLTLLEDLATQFGGAFVQVVNSPVISSSTATTNPALNLAYDGGSNAGMFDGVSGQLDVNQTITVQIVVELDPDSPTAVYDAITGDGNTDLENQAESSGEDPATSDTVTDLSDDPNDPDNDDGSRDNPTDDDNDPDDPVSLFLPDVTLHKNLVAGPVPAESGTAGNFELTYDLEIVNTGNDRLTNLSLLEDLATQYGGAFVQIVGSPTIVASTATDDPEILAAFDGGTTDDQLIDNSGLNTNLLMPGEAVTIRIVIEVDPDSPTAVYSNGSLENQATASGEGLSSGETVTDNSDDQNDPTDVDPDDDNNPDDPSNIRIPDITLDKVVDGTPVLASSGTFANYDVTYRFTIENTGTTPLENPVLTDDWVAQFGAAFIRIVPGTIAVTNNNATTPPAANTSYAGGANENLLDGTGLVDANESFEVSLVVEIDPNAAGAVYTNGQLVNQANIVADDPATGLPTGDSSDDTNDPTDSDPDTDNNPDDPTTVSISEIGAAKRIVSSVPIPTSPGHVELTYEIRVRNLGSMDLDNLTLVDNFAANLGPAYQSITAPPTMFSSTASIDPSFNAAFNGASDANVFDGASGLLRPGEEMVVRFTLDVQVDLLTSASMNQAIAGGDDPNDNPVSDPSDTGSDPEGTNPNQTGDTGGEDDPTLPPAVGIAKNHGTPIRVGNEWLVPVEIIVHNIGLTNLSNLILTEDLASAFGPAYISTTTPVIDGSGVTGGVVPGINAGWPGNTSLNVLDGTGLLTPNDLFSVSFDVLVDPDATGTSTYLTNQSQVNAIDPINPDTEVIDTSDSGSDTTGTNPGEPGDSGSTDDPTPLQIPDIGLAKDIAAHVQNGAAFDLTFVLVVENIGTIDLANISLFDDFATQFAPHIATVVSPPTIISSNATTDPNLNSAYVGNTALDMFDGVSGFLAPGEEIQVSFVVSVLPDYSVMTPNGLELVNQASTSGVGLNADGTPLPQSIPPATDDSDNGTNANSDNGFGDTNDPTPFVIQIFAWDSFNNFSRGHDRPTRISNFQMRPRTMNTIYTGIVEPGTTLNFSIYDQTGQEIGNRTVVADAAGNWLAHFPNATVHSNNSHFSNSHFGASFDGNASRGLGSFGSNGHRTFHNSHTLFGPHFSSRTFTASTLGHRLYHMPGTEIDGQPHRVEMRQTPAIYNTSLGSPNMHFGGQRHFQPALHPTNYFFQRSSVGSTTAGSASNALRAAHSQNMNPLQLGIDANEVENRTRTVTW